ncbi:MAG: tRNA (adenosine(37)-N6)-dimethylallyltransferase MiaA [Chloroflexota bacterium]
MIVLLGPTAVGKTALSAALCNRYGGHVVNADSRQIYRQMDIGTAKPTPDEITHAPHHLIDIRNPDESLSLSEYQTLAYQTINDLHAKQIQPLLIGGSALYIRSVVEGLRIPEVPPNPELRAELEALGANGGWQALFAKLEDLDPATAQQIDRRNMRRVIRALEIVMMTGQSKVELEGKEQPPYRILQIGLDRPRENLYQRIDQRVDLMIERGLIDETKALLATGYDIRLPAMTSLGYREIIAYINGTLTLDDAIAQIKTETHRFVRHQYTWFRRMANIDWFDMTTNPTEGILTHIEEFLDNPQRTM